jgi:transglutaminase-like putative cysteine protease
MNRGYRRMIPVVVVVLAAVTLAGRTSDNPKRQFRFSYEVRVPQLPPETKSLRLWIPLPRIDKFQSVSDLKITSPAPYGRRTDAEYGNDYVYVDVPASTAKNGAVEVKVEFRAVRREHFVRLAPIPRGGTGEKEQTPLSRYLAPDRLVPTDGVIAQLSSEQTQGLKTPLEKARAIYNYVVKTMRYDKSGEGWGHGDAIWACTAKRGNCTDFHSLFIGMMRHAGIPARFEIGFSLPEGQHESAIPGYHCWAEFYVEPYGWIPVDASEAWKHPEKRDYFFGAHDTNRVLFTIGRDIRLRPAQHGDPLNYFIYPYAEVDGAPFTRLEEKFSFRDVDN